MKKNYNHKKIEKHVQLQWKIKKTFKATIKKNKKKYYCLSMIPYPSGKLHIGHVRNYTIGDVISRYNRMLGKNVLHPIGWDAFGLPAENAAIENKVDPKIWTKNNISYMKNQLKSLGLSYDWDREINTSSSKYYKWEQWLFIKLYKKGLVYNKTGLVNWCPNDNTILANEQVINNKCWRCNTKIEHKNMPQWYLKITHYADELLNDLNNLKGWPKKVKNMQKNWIGKTTGIEVNFKIFNTQNKISIYIKKPEIFMGITYLIITPNHFLSKKSEKKNKKIKNFIKKWKNNECNYKTAKYGIKTKYYAIHPFTTEKLPIWIINVQKFEYNYNIKAAIPSYNKKDLQFAKKYKLKIKKIISNKNKKILINSSEFSGMAIKEASKNIKEKIISQNIGKIKTNYNLHDWSISRQRYWGAPIPIIQKNDGSYITIPINKLPFKLHKKTNTNNNINKTQEIETFDTFVESSWYYARYVSPNYNKKIINKKSAKYWLPIDQYIGGIEHATMHLLYFRFFHKLMRDIGLIQGDEPATNLLCQGMILSEAFYYINKENKKIWVPYKNVIIKKDKKNKIIKIIDKNKNNLIYAGMIKMSKSKNNGVNPKKFIKKYGADTIRLFLMFAAPPENSLEWKESGIKGANRFINKIWKIIYTNINQKKTKKINKTINNLNKKEKTLKHELQNTINKVTQDISKKYKFNTAISSIMKFVNKLEFYIQQNQINNYLINKSLNTIVCLLFPFIPHVCFVLWKILGNKNDIDTQKWPTNIKNNSISNKIKIIIQINSKFKDIITINKKDSKKNIINKAIEIDKIKNLSKGKKIKKIIYIKEKVLNLIIE